MNALASRRAFGYEFLLKLSSISLSHAPRYKSSLENQRRRLDSFGASIGASPQDMSPWYSVDLRALNRAMAGILQGVYGGSVFAMLCTVYPEHTWLPWRFQRLPKRSIGNVGAMKLLVAHVRHGLCLDDDGDKGAWQRVSRDQLLSLGVLHFVDAHGGLDSLLRRLGQLSHGTPLNEL